MKKLKQVYLIDDSRAVNAMNKSLLEQLNIADELLVFEDGQEAFSNIVKNTTDKNYPDIIFLDLEMPDVGGFDFLDMLIDHFSKHQIDHEWLVVFLSDHLHFENFSKTKQYKGFSNIDHIRKPMDGEDIINLLEEHFNEEN